MADKVTTAEGNMDTLKVAQLKKQMTQMQQAAGSMAYWLEDADGRSRRNNICVLGFPDRSEGQAVERLLED